MGSRSIGVPRLVGRVPQREELVALLVNPAVRLVTLHGPVGIGKSALAAAVLPAVAPRFGGAHFIDLGGLEPRTALSRLASVIAALPARRSPEPAGRSPWLRELLFVDHAELLGGYESEIEAIAARDKVTVVRMSTRPPNDASSAIRVGPLPGDEIARLLRANGVPADQVGPLCASAAGNPLLARLMAARLSIEAPESLVERLRGAHSPLDVLTTPPTADAAGLGIIADLATFTAAFTADAACAVTGRSAEEVADLLTALLGLGLLRVDDSAPLLPHDLRFRLPRLVRDHLRSAAPADPEVGRRHALHYAALARRAALKRDGCDDAAAIALSDGNHDDLLTALRWFVEHSPAEAIRLAVDLLPEAHRSGDESAVVHSVERLLQGQVPDAIRLEALAWLVLIDSRSPDAVQHIPRIKERLAACENLSMRMHDETQRIFPLMVEMQVLAVLRDFERATRAATQGAALAERVGRTAWQNRFELGLATISHELGDHASAEERASSVLTRALRSGDGTAISYAALLLSRLPSASPTGPGGLPILRTALAFAKQLDDRQLQSFALTMLALHTLSTSDPSAAARWLVERYELSGRKGTWQALGPQIVLTMGMAARLDDQEVTAYLHGSLQPWSALVLAGLPRALADTYHWASTRARAALGEVEFDRRAREGAAVSLEVASVEAVDYVLGVDDPDRLRARPASQRSLVDLTARERDVLRLLAQGSRNREIAEDLVISPKTVMHHTSAIYRKLGVRGRAEATALAVRLGMVEPP